MTNKTPISTRDAAFDQGNRDRPDTDFIEAIRSSFPVETEIDRILTRKMKRRGGLAFEIPALETLVEGTRALITDELGYPVEIANADWLSGGASKLQMVFDLVWRGADGSAPGTSTRLVLRMEPSASVTESSRIREFEILRTVENILPVPHAFWVDAEGEYLPYPALVCGFVTGVGKPSTDPGKVTGLGQNYGPELRKKLAPDFVKMLARLHRMDVPPAPALASFERPVSGSNESVIRQVNAFRRIWEEDRIEEEPLLAVVYKWLIRHAPAIDHISIIHADYRSGNFLFDEQSGKITAWLDWEGSTLGDRHQDVTYAALPIFRHFAEDGETPLVSGMMTESELYEAYNDASDLPLDPERLRYFAVFNRYSVSILLLAAAARAAATAATHQDVLLNHVSALGYVAISELGSYYREVTA